MPGYERSIFLQLSCEKKYDLAVELAKASHKATEPFSSDNLYSLVDAYALCRQLHPDDRTWDPIFPAGT